MTRPVRRKDQPQECPRCAGSGWLLPVEPSVQYRMCPVCKGTGREYTPIRTVDTTPEELL